MNPRFLSILFLSCATTCMAQVLSLDSCVSLALKGNVQLRNAEAQVDVYRHKQQQYRANYLPNISLQATDMVSNIDNSLTLDVMRMLPTSVTTALHNTTQTVMNQLIQAGFFTEQEAAAMQQKLQGAISAMAPHIDYQVKNVFMGGVLVEQPIYMGGKVTAAYNMSKLGRQMAEQNLALTEDQVIVQTHEAYALMVKAVSLRQVAQQYDSLLSQLLSDVMAAERHGLRHHNDVLKVEVKKHDAELQMLQADNAVSLARMNLCHSIGLPLDAPVEVEVMQSAEPLSATEQPLPHMDGTIAGRPEVALLELKTQLAEQQVKLDRSDFLPQLGVMGYVGYTHGVKLMDQYLLKGTNFSLIASLKVPLYHFGEGRHKVKAAKLELERTRMEQEELTEKMNLELRQAANRLQESLLEVDITTRALASAQANLAASQSAFRNGLESLGEHLESQTLWQQAQARHAIARTQLIADIARYRKAAGQL